MKKQISTVLLAASFVVCGCTERGGKQDTGHAEENRRAVEMLQGIWLDDDTEMPVLKVRGDTIILASQAGAPFRFSISSDTLFSQGVERTVYVIKSLSEHSFKFYTAMGDTVKLHKAEDAASFDFEFRTAPVVQQPREVIQKDSVFNYAGKRYRGYVYINPSTRKVVVPELTDEGMTVENTYYDNVIHICVYQGREKLYSKDITKDMFSGTIPDSFLQGAILSDMNFIGVDGAHFLYRATVCSTPSYGDLCYYVDLCIDREDKQLSYKLKQ